MLGLGEDPDSEWEIPAPEDIENIFDGDFMQLLACPSENFDVLETGCSDLAPGYAPAEDIFQGEKELDVVQQPAADLSAPFEPQQPPRKKRTRQPVPTDVANSRLEKTRARNRRAQAKFRERQKVCQHTTIPLDCPQHAALCGLVQPQEPCTREIVT